MSRGQHPWTGQATQIWRTAASKKLALPGARVREEKGTADGIEKKKPAAPETPRTHCRG